MRAIGLFIDFVEKCQNGALNTIFFIFLTLLLNSIRLYRKKMYTVRVQYRAFLPKYVNNTLPFCHTFSYVIYPRLDLKLENNCDTMRVAK